MRYLMRARGRVLARLLGILACVAATGAAAAGEGARMNRAVATLASQGHFMGSVLVVRGSHVLLDRAYGNANLELQVPDTPQTRYRLGSITKQFTAAAILLLQERGLLKVTDPIGHYLPDAPAAWAAVTLQDLLRHTSGIPSYSDLPDFDATRAQPATPAQLIGRFRDLPLLFAPGTAWRYSNSNYALLGYLIERISGQSYAQFLQQNIFKPLGMSDSGYDSNSQLIAGRAEGYTPGADDKPVNAQYIDMSVPYAAGGLYSTTHDLLLWEQALYGGRLLSAGSLQQMTSPYMNDYGFGLTIRTLPGGQLLYSHGGSIYGFNGELSYLPREQLAVIVLANLNGPAPQILSRQLLSLALHDPRIAVAPPRPVMEQPDATAPADEDANPDPPSD